MSTVDTDKAQKTVGRLPGLLGHSGEPMTNETSAFITGELRRQLLQYDQISGDGGRAMVARYGCIGHIAREMPIVVYDHPALSAEFPTAFTEGTAVFINLQYALHVLRKDHASDMRENTCLGILVHELSHIARFHTRGRLAGSAPPDVLNYVFDACINASNLRAFPWLQGEGTNGWVGVTPSAIAKFASKSEEEALHEYLQDPETFEAAAGGPEPSKGKGGKEQMHFTSTKDLAEFLERNGLRHVLDELGLPASDDAAGHAKLQREIQRRMTSAAERTLKDLNRARQIGARTPGAHMDESFSEQVALSHRAKLTFKLQLRRVLRALGRAGYGMTDELPDPIRYSPPGSMGFNSSPYLPGYNQTGRRQHKLVHVIDTSGSMGPMDLSECLTEVDAFTKQRGGNEPEHLVHCADTALRGKPVVLSKASKAEMVKQNENQAAQRVVTMHGRGGTDLEHCLVEIAHLYRREMQRGMIPAVLYYTDLGDSPPSRAALPPWFPKTVFICPEGCYSNDFAHAVSSWAEVVKIAPGETVYISDEILRGAQAAHQPEPEETPDL